MNSAMLPLYLSDTALLDALAPPAAGEAVIPAACRRADAVEAIAGRFAIPRDQADAALEVLLRRPMDQPAGGRR